MLVNRTIFIIVTISIMITLLILKINPLVAGTITLVIVVTGYIIIGYTRNKKRLFLLEESCDPQAFLESTENQRAITGKNSKIDAYLNIDKAAGLITMGEFEGAKELLLSMDKTKLSVKNGTLLAYTINLISCLYELGEISRAEEIFETQIPVLPPVNPVMVMAVKLLIAERFFFLGRYDESKEKFNELLSQKTSRRVRLGILYRLAQIDEKANDIKTAQERYHQVVGQGNKLWIAGQARKSISIE